MTSSYSGKAIGLSGLRALRGDLQRRNFDLTLNSTSTSRRFPTVLSRAPHRLGFERGRAREGVMAVRESSRAARARRPTQDMFLEFLDVLGVAAQPLDWELQLTEAEQATAAPVEPDGRLSAADCAASMLGLGELQLPIEWLRATPSTSRNSETCLVCDVWRARHVMIRAQPYAFARAAALEAEPVWRARQHSWENALEVELTLSVRSKLVSASRRAVPQGRSDIDFLNTTTSSTAG